MFATSPQAAMLLRRFRRSAVILGLLALLGTASSVQAKSEASWWHPKPTCTPRPTCSPTATPVVTATDTPEPTATDTPEVTATPTVAPTDTPEPTATDTPEVTPTPTVTATPEITETPLETPTDTVSPTPTETPIGATAALLLSPSAGTSVVGGKVKLKVVADTQGNAVTGGTVSITFDTTFLIPVGVTANIAVAFGSPFAIVGSPVITPGQIDIAFAEPSSIPTVFNGQIITLELQGIATTGATTVALDPVGSGFTPAIPGTFFGTGTYQIIPNGRPVGDFNSDGCTDIQDFLYLLDYWQTETDLGPPDIGVQDFLNLLDYWQTGAGCV